MDDTPEKHFSFPNSDQAIAGVSGPGRPAPETARPSRPTVNIIDALNTEKLKEVDLEKIHTYQEDIASTIKNDNVSMIKMALAEKKRQERQGAPLEFKENNSKKYVVIGGIAFVVLVFIIGGVIIATNIGRSATPETANQSVALLPLLYTEERVAISTDNRDSDDLTRLIKREGDNPPALGAMRGIVLTANDGTGAREISTQDFFSDLKTHAPDSLLRSFDPQFLLGLYAFSPNDFFILLKVNTYDTAFAGMLQWEPDIENDLGSIMITRKPVVPAILPPSSTTPAVADFTPTNGRAWVDRVVNNKDARVLVDSDGGIAMLYTFLDKQTLVISSSDKALKEVMFRLTAGRIAR